MWGAAPGAAGDSAAQAEIVEELLIARGIFALEIVEKRAALIHHLEQALTRMVVLLVRVEVRCQAVDTLGQQCDLHFRRTGVVLGALEFFHHRAFAFHVYRHLPSTPDFSRLYEAAHCSGSPRS